jgi:hypothetical protein
MKKTFTEIASHVTFSRSCGSGYFEFDERVYGAMQLAYERGADFYSIEEVEDHKGDLMLHIRKLRHCYGLHVKDANIIAQAWADYTGYEFYENVQIVNPK